MSLFSPSSLKSRIRLTLTAVLLGALTSSCGSGKDNGENIAIGVRPGDDVLLGPGPEPSCLDRMTFKATGLSLDRSVRGPVLVFNKFILNWTSTDTLYVSAIRIKVDGTGINGGQTETELTSSEIEALLARIGGIIVGKATIVSTDVGAQSNRGTGSDFAPCSLVIGGIQLVNGTHTPSFRGRVTIEIIGSAEDSDHNLRLVRQRAYGTFLYEGG